MKNMVLLLNIEDGTKIFVDKKDKSVIPPIMVSEDIPATKAYHIVCRQKHLDELYSIEEKVKLQKFCDILGSEKVQKQLDESDDPLKIEIPLQLLII